MEAIAAAMLALLIANAVLAVRRYLKDTRSK